MRQQTRRGRAEARLAFANLLFAFIEALGQRAVVLRVVCTGAHVARSVRLVEVFPTLRLRRHPRTRIGLVCFDRLERRRILARPWHPRCRCLRTLHGSRTEGRERGGACWLPFFAAAGRARGASEPNEGRVSAWTRRALADNLLPHDANFGVVKASVFGVLLLHRHFALFLLFGVLVVVVFRHRGPGAGKTEAACGE